MVPDPEQPGGFRLARKDAASAEGAGAPSAPDQYCCSSCERPIATELVIRIDPERRPAPGGRSWLSGTTGYMLIAHLCACCPLILTSRRYRSYEAFVAMFGKGVSLPYESPFKPAEVSDDDPPMIRWRWELEQTSDADEFLYWLEHHQRD
jgi:hypothetical protein